MCWGAPGCWPRPKTTQHSDVHSMGSAWMLSAALATAVVPPSAARLWKLPLQQRERLAGVVRAIWSLLAWHAGRGKVLCGRAAAEGLGRAGNTEPVCLGLSDESLPLCVQ